MSTLYFNRSFTGAWFYNMYWQFGKCCFHCYTDLSNVDTVHYTEPKKSHSLISPLLSSEVFKYWKAAKPIYGGGVSFKKFYFLLESSDSVSFSWSNRLILSISRKRLPRTQVWISMIYLSVVISRKMVFHLKVTSSAHNSVSQVLFLGTTQLEYATEILYLYFLFCYTKY